MYGRIMRQAGRDLDSTRTKHGHPALEAMILPSMVLSLPAWGWRSTAVAVGPALVFELQLARRRQTAETSLCRDDGCTPRPRRVWCRTGWTANQGAA